MNINGGRRHSTLTTVKYSNMLVHMRRYFGEILCRSENRFPWEMECLSWMRVLQSSFVGKDPEIPEHNTGSVPCVNSYDTGSVPFVSLTITVCELIRKRGAYRSLKAYGRKVEFLNKNSPGGRTTQESVRWGRGSCDRDEGPLPVDSGQ